MNPKNETKKVSKEAPAHLKLQSTQMSTSKDKTQKSKTTSPEDLNKYFYSSKAAQKATA